MKKFKEYISEMPYIKWQQSKDNLFDVEEEKMSKETKDFIKIIKDLFNGKKHKDKYGNIIQLKSDNDKKEFLKSLLDPEIGTLGMYHDIKDVQKINWSKELGIKI
jgi:hypothetical protein